MNDEKRIDNDATRSSTDVIYSKVPTFDLIGVLDNEYQYRDYVIVCRTDEITCISPDTELPTFGVITIEYIPDKKCINTNSLKYYFYAYRSYKIYMESLVNKVLDDCVRACAPKWMRVICNFKGKDGITVDVAAEHGRMPFGTPMGFMNANDQQKQ